MVKGRSAQPRSGLPPDAGIASADTLALGTEARLAFEQRLSRLRLIFLLSPILMLLAYGWPALRSSAFVELVIAFDCLMAWLMLRQAPGLVLRWQLILRFVDLGAVYIALQIVHTFIGHPFYDSVYLFFVMAAAASHGRTGAWIMTGAASVAVLVGRIELIAQGVLHYELRDITDAAFYGGFFIATGSITLYLMRKSAEAVDQRDEALRESEMRYRELFENASDIVYVHDLNGNFLSFNRAAERKLGYSRRDLPGLTLATVIAPEHIRRAKDMIERKVTGQGVTTYDVDLLTRDRRRLTVEVSSRAIMRQGIPVAIQGIARDITDRKTLEEQLRHQALHDPLTALPNRVLLQDRLEQAILTANRNATSCALLLMDLDRFKDVNDTLGHAAGDLLLQEVARRVQQTIRQSDTVARLGGDEFAVVLPGTGEEQASQVAGMIVEGLRIPLILEGRHIDLAGSVGIAVYPWHGHDARTLLRRADVAMYAAKRADDGPQVFRLEDEEGGPRRLSLVAEFREAIQDGQFVLHYQPKVALRTGTVSKVEALVRWQHPEQGLIAPGEFIPLAESTGLIEALTLWVLRAALEQTATWRACNLDLGVSVNLCARNLRDGAIVHAITRLLKETGTPATRLTVEITESTLMEDPERARELLIDLHDLGVGIAIDDFGTGYSSLAYLQQLPANEIKIDRSFIRDLTGNSAVIVRSIIDLARNLGLVCVAEGVESDATWDGLAGMGCGSIQGYALSRPLPADELRAWMDHRHSPHVPRLLVSDGKGA